MNKIKKTIWLFLIISFVFSIDASEEIIKTKSSEVTIFKKKKEVKITIFVHGTHLTKYLNQFMHLPNDLTKITDLNNSVFYKSVIGSLIKADSKSFPEDSFYIFGWTGELSHNARIDAAQELYNKIKKLIKNKNHNYKIAIIAHSHGGNVALNLAEVCDENDPIKIDKLVLLGTPVQEKTKHYVKHNIFNKIYNIYSSLDTIQLIDMQKFHPESKWKNTPLFSQRQFDSHPNLKQTKIKINDRALFHVEFILDNFLSILPMLIKEMDNLDSNKLNYLIKINLKNKSIETIDSNKKLKKKKEIKKQFMQTNKNITIFVHGSHNGSSRLFIKYVDENNKLTHISQLNEHKHHTYLIAKNFCRTAEEFNSFYAFGWSGITKPEERFNAAQILFEEIKSLLQNCETKPKLTIITHSHGGNVFLNLARIINSQDPEFEIDRAILLACPVQEETKNFIKRDDVFKKIYHVYSSLDTFQVMDPQRLHIINRNKRNIPFFSKRRFDYHDNLRQGKIKINNRALFHVEFILENFLQVLPEILNEMDQKEVNGRDLIKVKTK